MRYNKYILEHVVHALNPLVYFSQKHIFFQFSCLRECSASFVLLLLYLSLVQRCRDGWTSMYGIVVFYYRRSITHPGMCGDSDNLQHKSASNLHHQSFLASNSTCSGQNDDHLQNKDYDEETHDSTENWRRNFSSGGQRYLQSRGNWRGPEHSNFNGRGPLSNENARATNSTSRGYNSHYNEGNGRWADQGFGEIVYEVAGQKCSRCNPDIYETPLWYNDEAQKVCY